MSSSDDQARRGFSQFLTLVGGNALLTNSAALFLPIYFHQLGLTGFEIGIYFALSSAAAILLALPVGVSSDRMRIAKILVVGLALAAVNRLGFLVTERFGWFCIYALLGSFGARFFSTASQALFFKLTGSENKQQTGRYMLVHFTCSCVGMLLGGWLIQRFDFRAVFAFGVLANLGLMGYVVRLPRNECVTLEMAEYKRAILQPRVLLLTAIFFLSSLHWGAEQTSYLPFLKINLGLSLFAASLYAATGLLFVGAGAALGAKLLERRLVKDLSSLLWLGFALAGLFHILMCVPIIWASFLARCLHEIGDGFVLLVYYQGIAKVFKLDRIGGCAAFVSLWTAVANMLGALIFGWVGGRFGYQWPLMLSGALLMFIPLFRPLLTGFDAESGLASALGQNVRGSAS